MEYQEKKLNKFREREVIVFFGFIMSDVITYIGKPFFGKTMVKEQKYKSRFTYFDEYNYQDVWQKWKTSWRVIK